MRCRLPATLGLWAWHTGWAGGQAPGPTWVEASLPGARQQEVGAGVNAEDGIHGGPIQVRQGWVDCSIVLCQGIPLDAKDVWLRPEIQQDSPL